MIKTHYAESRYKRKGLCNLVVEFVDTRWDRVDCIRCMKMRERYEREQDVARLKGTQMELGLNLEE